MKAITVEQNIVTIACLCPKCCKAQKIFFFFPCRAYISRQACTSLKCALHCCTSFRDQKSSLKGLLCQRFIRVPLNAVAYAWFLSFGKKKEKGFCPGLPHRIKDQLKTWKLWPRLWSLQRLQERERLVYFSQQEKHGKCLTVTSSLLAPFTVCVRLLFHRNDGISKSDL